MLNTLSCLQVEQIARDNFLFLVKSEQYDVKSLPHYDPKDGDIYAPAKIATTVCYVFKPFVPPEGRFANLRKELQGIYAE